MKALATKIPNDIYYQFKELAEKNNETKSFHLRHIVEDYVKNQSNPNKPASNPIGNPTNKPTGKTDNSASKLPVTLDNTKELGKIILSTPISNPSNPINNPTKKTKTPTPKKFIKGDPKGFTILALIVTGLYFLCRYYNK